MDNIREIVCENLIALRKSKGLTQVELSKYVNYSDKAISRWEKGEVMPDYEVLGTLSELYNVKIGYFFEKHDKEKANKKDYKRINQVFLAILAGFTIYTIVTTIYVYLMIYRSTNLWELFLWGVPVTSIVLMIVNTKLMRLRIFNFVCLSVMLWSLLVCIYIQFISLNMWLIFIIGVPVQVCFVFIFLITGGFKKKKEEDKNI